MRISSYLYQWCFEYCKDLVWHLWILHLVCKHWSIFQKKFLFRRYQIILKKRKKGYIKTTWANKKAAWGYQNIRRKKRNIEEETSALKDLRDVSLQDGKIITAKLRKCWKFNRRTRKTWISYLWWRYF